MNHPFLIEHYKMLPIVAKLPKKMFVAVSGGVDSVASALVLRDRGIDVTVAHYHHRIDGFSDREFDFTVSFATTYGFPLVVESCTERHSQGSKEQFWRNSRRQFFTKLGGLVATGHTLDDCVEWYLYTCFKGFGYVPPYQSQNTVKPLMMTKKETLVEYCKERNVSWLEDPTNADPSFASRNRIRHDILPNVQLIAPGIYTTVKRLIRERIAREKEEQT